jgi:hypothetical protein
MRVDLICIFSNDEFGATRSSVKDFVSLLWNTVFLLEKIQEKETIQKRIGGNILILFA